KKLYIVAGRRLSVESVRDLAPLGGIDVFLYRRGAGAAAGELEKVSTNASSIDSGLLLTRLNELGTSTKRISVNAPQQLGPAKSREGSAGHIQGATQTLTAEQQFHVITFTGPNDELTGALALVSSRQALQQLERQVRNVAFAVAAIAVILALLVSGWTAARITRPVERLALAADEVASG